VAAIRQAIRMRDREMRAAGLADPLILPPAAPADPEIEDLRTHYRDEFQQACRSTLADLPLRDGNVLRLFYGNGLGSEDIARCYQVTERTVRRGLAAARERIMKETPRRPGGRA